MTYTITVILFILTIVLGINYARAIRKHKQLSKQYSKLLSQKKSSEITTGQIAEKLVPFLDYFNYNPRDALFCGNPIDYIIFGEDKITFLEVKTGNARLTKKQKRIKSIVQNKNVSWEEIRIK